MEPIATTAERGCVWVSPEDFAEKMTLPLDYVRHLCQERGDAVKYPKKIHPGDIKRFSRTVYRIRFKPLDASFPRIVNR